MRTLRIAGSTPGVELAVRVTGPAAGVAQAVPTALFAHGAGSDAGFVLRAFAGPLTAAGWRVAAVDLRGHAASTPVRDPCLLLPEHHGADLDRVAEVLEASLVGGVSMGAHAAVLAALRRQQRGQPLRAVALVMPAWTGPPGLVAAANVLQAQEIEQVGLRASLARIVSEHPGWVADELAGSWPLHDPAAFAAVLRALGTAPAPEEHQLAALACPAVVVALDDDPLHPSAVAEHWADLLPDATLVRVSQHDVGADRETLGRAVAGLVSASR